MTANNQSQEGSRVTSCGLLDEGGEGGRAGLKQIRRGQFQRQAAHTTGDVDIVFQQCQLLDECNESAFHSDGGDSAADITGQSQKLVGLHQINRRRAGQLASTLQRNGEACRQAEDEMLLIRILHDYGLVDLLGGNAQHA